MMHLTELLSHHFIHAFGWTLIHSLWQGALIYFLMWTILKAIPLHKPHIRLTISYMSLITVLTSVIFTFILLYKVDVEIVLHGSSMLPSTTIQSMFFSHSADASWGMKLISFVESKLPLLLSLWFIGIVIFGAKLLLGFSYMKDLRNSAILIDVPLIESFKKKIIRQIKIEKAFEIAESSMTKVPIVLGHFKPLILLPIGTINNLPPEHVEAILLHEMVHIARNDYLLNLIQSIIDVLLFFNPAIWSISATIRTERENRCDDVAVDLMESPLLYVKALLGVQEYQNHQKIILAMRTTKDKMLNRVRRILNQPYRESNFKDRLFALALLIIVGTLSAFVSERQGGNPPISEPVKDAFIANAFAIENKGEVLDTIRPKGSKKTFIKKEDDKKIEMTMVDDSVTTLKVEGVQVPSEELAEHVELIEKSEKRA